MNYFLVIVNAENKVFSKIKKNGPKMLQTLKDLCEQYKEMFKSEFKVKRVLITKTGYKFI